MTLVDRKITDTQISTNGVVSAPDKLIGTAAQNKAIFDNLIKTTVKTELNGVIDDLTATTDGASGADQIGATAISGLSGTTLQTLLENLQTLAAHVAGAETFTGVKTFAVSPKVPTPTVDSDAVPKSYVMPLASAYTKTEIDTAISMVEGAIASINGMSNAGGNITIEDSGSGTIGVTVDVVNNKIKLAAMGTVVPANHATAHEAGGADVVHLANMTYDNTISGLSATNPKSAIDELASEKMDAIAKATQAEAEAGTDDTKYMTSVRTKEAITVLAPKAKKEIARFTSSGTWTVPAGVTNVDVYVVGGGGGGGSASRGGGGGGYCKLFEGVTIIPTTTYNCVIGAGGAAGTNGGQSYFQSVTYAANGGSGCTGAAGAAGGSSGGSYSNIGLGGNGGSGGGTGSGNAVASAGGGNTSYQPINPYDGIAYGCGGGGAAGNASYAGGVGGGSGGAGGYTSNGGNAVGIGGGGGGSASTTAYSGGAGAVGGGGGGGAGGVGGSGGAGIVIIYG